MGRSIFFQGAYKRIILNTDRIGLLSAGSLSVSLAGLLGDGDEELE